MTEKQEIIRMIEELPDSSTLEDIMEEIFFRKKVEEGLEDLEKGRIVSHEEAKKRLGRWLIK